MLLSCPARLSVHTAVRPHTFASYHSKSTTGGAVGISPAEWKGHGAPLFSARGASASFPSRQIDTKQMKGAADRSNAHRFPPCASPAPASGYVCYIASAPAPPDRASESHAWRTPLAEGASTRPPRSPVNPERQKRVGEQSGTAVMSTLATGFPNLGRRCSSKTLDMHASTEGPRGRARRCSGANAAIRAGGARRGAPT